MKVMKTADIEAFDRESKLFKGHVTAQTVLDTESSALRASLINFDRGAVNVFHVHEYDQNSLRHGGRGDYRYRKGGSPHQAGRFRPYSGGRETLARRHAGFGDVAYRDLDPG